MNCKTDTILVDGVEVTMPFVAVEALAAWIADGQTGQLTFHFAKGTLRQIQRNAFETVT